MSVSPFAPSMKSQKMRHAYYIKSVAVEVHGVQFANSFFRLVIQYWIYFKAGRSMISYSLSLTIRNYIYQKDKNISMHLVIIDIGVGTLT